MQRLKDKRGRVYSFVIVQFFSLFHIGDLDAVFNVKSLKKTPTVSPGGRIDLASAFLFF